jgi:hypothetical protein
MVCFIIAVVLWLLTTVICTRNYLLARGWIGTQSNLPHRPRQFNIDYHCNRDLSVNEEDKLSIIVRRASMNRAGTQSTVTTREKLPPFIHLNQKLLNF